MFIFETIRSTRATNCHIIGKYGAVCT